MSAAKLAVKRQCPSQRTTHAHRASADDGALCECKFLLQLTAGRRETRLLRRKALLC
jgi:hypothetical protein